MVSQNHTNGGESIREQLERSEEYVERVGAADAYPEDGELVAYFDGDMYQVYQVGDDWAIERDIDHQGLVIVTMEYDTIDGALDTLRAYVDAVAE